MVDPQQHAEHRGWMESILRHIPGFHGYLEAEYRRESDRLARSYLSNRIDAARQNVQAYQQYLVNAGNLADLTHCERVEAALIALGNQIRGDVQGYSGFFDFVTVNTTLLDRVYEHDMALLNDAEALVTATSKLTTTPGDAATLASQLKTQADALAQKFSQRRAMLEGLGGK